MHERKLQGPTHAMLDPTTPRAHAPDAPASAGVSDIARRTHNEHVGASLSSAKGSLFGLQMIQGLWKHSVRRRRNTSEDAPGSPANGRHSLAHWADERPKLRQHAGAASCVGHRHAPPSRYTGGHSAQRPCGRARAARQTPKPHLATPLSLFSLPPPSPRSITRVPMCCASAVLCIHIVWYSKRAMPMFLDNSQHRFGPQTQIHINRGNKKPNDLRIKVRLSRKNACGCAAGSSGCIPPPGAKPTKWDKSLVTCVCEISTGRSPDTWAKTG